MEHLRQFLEAVLAAIFGCLLIFADLLRPVDVFCSASLHHLCDRSSRTVEVTASQKVLADKVVPSGRAVGQRCVKDRCRKGVHRKG